MMSDCITSSSYTQWQDRFAPLGELGGSYNLFNSISCKHSAYPTELPDNHSLQDDSPSFEANGFTPQPPQFYWSGNQQPRLAIAPGAPLHHHRPAYSASFQKSLSYPGNNGSAKFVRMTSDPQMVMKVQQQGELAASINEINLNDISGARLVRQNAQLKHVNRSHSYISQDTSESSDEDNSPSHPNKFPVAIEEHKRPECCYKRQQARSGHYIKVIKDNGETFNMKQNNIEMPTIENGTSEDPPQVVRYYRKDLVRMCRCGLYVSQEHMLNNSGRSNDSDGYEVHYSQKCKWKFYEDFKTKKRVLIRLCKCYKPTV